MIIRWKFPVFLADPQVDWHTSWPMVGQPWQSVRTDVLRSGHVEVDLTKVADTTVILPEEFLTRSFQVEVEARDLGLMLCCILIVCGLKLPWVK